MPFSSRRAERSSGRPSSGRSRGVARARHGRRLRSSIAGPYLPRLTGRALLWQLSVEDTVMYLRNVAPEYLDGVEVRFAALPTELRSGDGIDRFQVTGPREVTIYRVPLERLEKLHCEDPVHVRALAEMTVLAAIGELHGREPWNIAHDRYNG